MDDKKERVTMPTANVGDDRRREQESIIKQLNDASMMLQNTALDHMQGNVDELCKVLSLEVNNQLPECLFKEHFLDFFLGKLSDKEIKEKNLVETWKKIAGNAAGEVDLINAQGEVVALVPALMKGLSVEQIAIITSDVTGALRGSLAKASAHNRRIRDSGDKYFVAGTKELLIDTPKKIEDKEDTEKWNKLYAYFGVAGYKDDGQKSSGGNRNVNDQQDDLGLDFD